MKYLRLPGLAVAVLGLLGLMGLTGASAASATVICKKEVNKETGACPEHYPAGTEVKAQLVSGTKMVITTAFKTIECSEASMSGKLENEGSSITTSIWNTSVWLFGGCNCEVKNLSGGTIEEHWAITSWNSTLTSNGWEFTTTCSTIFGTVHCRYLTASTDIGTWTGAPTAKLDIASALPRVQTNSLCAEEANWIAEYEVTTPKPAYMGAS